MEKKLSLQKETIHRLGGSSISSSDLEASRNANHGMNFASSIRITTTITQVNG